MKNIVIILALTASTAVWAQKKSVPKTMADPATSQFVVDVPEASLRFTKENYNAVGAGAKIDGAVMTINASRAGRLYWFPRYIWVEPDTEYTLNYAAAITDNVGDALEIRVNMYDDPRDDVGEAVHKVGAGTFKFRTNHRTRYLRIEVASAAKARIAAKIEGLTLTQSSAGKAFAKRKELAVAGKVKCAQPYAEVAFDCKWGAAPAPGEVKVVWYSGNKEVGSYRCALTQQKGVEAVWNGLRAEWLRSWAHNPEGISARKEIFKNSSASGGQAGMVYKMAKPAGADSFAVSVKGAEGLEISGVKVTGIE